MQARVESLRMQAEAYLHTHLAAVPDTVGVPCAGFRMRQASGCAAQHGPLDLLSLALRTGCQLALQLNPFLSDTSAARLRKGSHVWLQVTAGRREDRQAAVAGRPALLPTSHPPLPPRPVPTNMCLPAACPPACSCVCWRTAWGGWSGWLQTQRPHPISSRFAAVAAAAPCDACRHASHQACRRSWPARYTGHPALPYWHRSCWCTASGA